MTFDKNRFNSATFERRTETVPVAVLSDFFGEDEKAEFEVQGLTHHEIAECSAGVQGNENLKNILQAAAGHKPSIKKAIEDILETSVEVPVDTQKRILQLVKGCLKPKLDEGTSVRIAERFPVEFIELTNKILELTGLGHIAVKKR